MPQHEPGRPRRSHRRAAVLPSALAMSAALLLAPAAGAAVAAPPATAPSAAGASAAAPSADPAARHAARLPEVIEGEGRALHPEGVAWDPTRSAFLVSSIRHGTVSVVGADGVARTLIDDPRLIATGAVRVDAARNRVLVTYGDVYGGPDALLSVGSSPETRGRHSGLAVYDLTTGEPELMVDLGGSPGLHLANDVAVDPFGNAYVTDSFTGTIHRVTPKGHASVLLSHPALDAGENAAGQPITGLNGIAYHPAGFLLTVRHDTGAVFRIPLAAPERFTEVRQQRPTPGADGVALGRNGALYVVTNAIAPGGLDGLLELRSRDGWRTARQTGATASPEAAPSAVALTPRGNYVLSGHLPVLFGSGGRQTADGFVLRRL
ncbi:SMP-30/gluconolactonase/LRE family protein [Allostreptomyces psammosilenae]|uniref:Sugar lactone lactonase YvrE n=1 Tax=Allostreptomyces psammosilenae TaxID=1892865 RepID=A0A852ZZQ8_9ACTN|nr:SMP-30/gluconolactonase/LRE family protein [Allostreptomyces psammosilenae]NYI04061.1 sugar lactone lactonase YvrE [Allostreptomyces psammosilenae]